MMHFLEPEIIAAVGVLATLVAAMLASSRSTVPYWFGLVFSAAALARASMLHLSTHLYGGAVLGDSYSIVVTVFTLLAVMAGLLLAWDPDKYGAEFPALLQLAGLGAMVMGFAGNLILLFLGLELLSLPLYVLAASRRTPLGGEAGLKYLLMGAFSSGILLFGAALLYGGTGSMTFVNFTAVHVVPGLMAAGLGFLLVGLLFKLAIVPFHMWVPDVYEGSPTPVAAFMAFGTKVGAAAALLRVLAFGFSLSAAWWGLMLGYLAVLTMIAGNMVALPQRDLKRLLAWSGVGNAGYVLVGIASHNLLGAQAALFYLLPYGLAILLAFTVVRVLEGREESPVTLASLKGLAYRQPWLAVGFLVAMLSLAGIPLTAGFIGKFYLVRGAIAADQWGVAVGLVVATIVGLAVYFRPVQQMFAPGDGASGRFTVGTGVVLAAAALGTLFIGIYPEPVLHAVIQSARFTWLH